MTDDYKERDNKFTGKIGNVVIEVSPKKMAAVEVESLQKAEFARKAAE